ncbi:MAG: GntR family transcriptional regulator, partial [Armatimonadota bacterium]
DAIEEDLRAAIHEGRELPIPLSLPRLAKHYDVSLTPVRLAVNALLKQQILLKSPNGRLCVHPSASKTFQRERRKGAIAQEVSSETTWAASLAERLTEEILRRSLRRDTEYLREEAVAQQMGVGRTVLRQAFNRLAGEGLLEHIPRRGWRVRIFDEKDMAAYLEARESLERTALTLARPYLHKADLEAMLAGNTPVSSEEAPQLNNDLHAYLIEKSGNPYIQDFFARHGRYWATLFDFAAPETHVLRDVAHQHRTILTALLQEDWEAADQALSKHIQAQRAIVHQLMMVKREDET